MLQLNAQPLWAWKMEPSTTTTSLPVHRSTAVTLDLITAGKFFTMCSGLRHNSFYPKTLLREQLFYLDEEYTPFRAPKCTSKNPRDAYKLQTTF